MKTHSSIEALYALVFAICVLLALFLLTSCGAKEAEAPEAHPMVRGQSVIFPKGSPGAERLGVERVEPPMERDLVLPARLTWDEDHTVRVFPPFAGRVTRLIAKVGDRVAAGQPLVEMMSPDFGQAQADARKAQADLALASQALERQKDLNSHGVSSQKDLQQAEADHARARAEADRAVGRLASYGHAVGGGNSFVLKSPVAGTVVERNLNPGQELRPDQPGAPLFVITDPSRLWVVVDATEADLPSLKVGIPLVITSNQFPEDAFAGELTQLSDFVDPNTRTLKARGVVPNPNHVLKGEMFVSARVKVPKGEYPTVNSKAVYLSGVRNYVFVRSADGAFTRRSVRVGRDTEGRVPVLSGLKEGEEAVVAGNLFLEQILSTTKPEAEVAKK
ncbi:MAG: efflux RND transporter periplasmic adaptor subunit [Usitatibacter sp.]